MTGDGGTARRLVDDVRRLGLETATEVVRRYSRLMAPPGGRRQESGASAPDRFDRLTDSIVTASAAMLGVVQDLSDIAGALPADAGGRDRLDVAVPAPGDVGTATIWVHNSSGDDVAPVELTASDLVGASGRIPATAVWFEPGTSQPVAAGGSLPVPVRVTAPSGVVSGVYHGVVSALGLPGAVLALRVEVGSGENGAAR